MRGPRGGLKQPRSVAGKDAPDRPETPFVVSVVRPDGHLVAWAAFEAPKGDVGSVESTLWLFAMMADDVIAGRTEACKVARECRAITANHGLSPTAMLQLGWRIGDEEHPEPAPVVPLKERSGRLRVMSHVPGLDHIEEHC